MTTRDRIFLHSGLMYEDNGVSMCRVCGAECAAPGNGHAPGCALDAAVSEVAPKESADELMARLRMEALDKLTGQDVDRCHELALELALAVDDERDGVLGKIAGFCGGASFFPEDRLGTSLFQLTAMVIVDP